jgi:hypothetical protein
MPAYLFCPSPRSPHTHGLGLEIVVLGVVGRPLGPRRPADDTERFEFSGEFVQSRAKIQEHLPLWGSLASGPDPLEWP